MMSLVGTRSWLRALIRSSNRCGDWLASRSSKGHEPGGRNLFGKDLAHLNGQVFVRNDNRADFHFSRDNNRPRFDVDHHAGFGMGIINPDAQKQR